MVLSDPILLHPAPILVLTGRMCPYMPRIGQLQAQIDPTGPLPVLYKANISHLLILHWSLQAHIGH